MAKSVKSTNTTTVVTKTVVETPVVVEETKVQETKVQETPVVVEEEQTLKQEETPVVVEEKQTPSKEKTEKPKEITVTDEEVREYSKITGITMAYAKSFLLGPCPESRIPLGSGLPKNYEYYKKIKEKFSKK